MTTKDVTSSLKDILNKAKPNKKEKSKSEQDREVKNLKVKLMDHQVEGLNFLLEREGKDVKNKGGLLCDDVSLLFGSEIRFD